MDPDSKKRRMGSNRSENKRKSSRSSIRSFRKKLKKNKFKYDRSDSSSESESGGKKSFKFKSQKQFESLRTMNSLSNDASQVVNQNLAVSIQDLEEKSKKNENFQKTRAETSISKLNSMDKVRPVQLPNGFNGDANSINQNKLE